MSMDLFDLHCDTITVCSSKNLELRRNDLHISLERLPAGSRWGQAFAIFVPDELRGSSGQKWRRTPTALSRPLIIKRLCRRLTMESSLPF